MSPERQLHVFLSALWYAGVHGSILMLRSARLLRPFWHGVISYGPKRINDSVCPWACWDGWDDRSWDTPADKGLERKGKEEGGGGDPRGPDPLWLDEGFNADSERIVQELREKNRQEAEKSMQKCRDVEADILRKLGCAGAQRDDKEEGAWGPQSRDERWQHHGTTWWDKKQDPTTSVDDRWQQKDEQQDGAAWCGKKQEPTTSMDDRWQQKDEHQGGAAWCGKKQEPTTSTDDRWQQSTDWKGGASWWNNKHDTKASTNKHWQQQDRKRKAPGWRDTKKALTASTDEPGQQKDEKQDSAAWWDNTDEPNASAEEHWHQQAQDKKDRAWWDEKQQATADTDERWQQGGHQHQGAAWWEKTQDATTSTDQRWQQQDHDQNAKKQDPPANTDDLWQHKDDQKDGASWWDTKHNTKASSDDDWQNRNGTAWWPRLKVSIESQEVAASTDDRWEQRDKQQDSATWWDNDKKQETTASMDQRWQQNDEKQVGNKAWWHEKQDPATTPDDRQQQQQQEEDRQINATPWKDRKFTPPPSTKEHWQQEGQQNGSRWWEQKQVSTTETDERQQQLEQNQQQNGSAPGNQKDDKEGTDEQWQQKDQWHHNSSSWRQKKDVGGWWPDRKWGQDKNTWYGQPLGAKSAETTWANYQPITPQGKKAWQNEDQGDGGAASSWEPHNSQQESWQNSSWSSSKQPALETVPERPSFHDELVGARDKRSPLGLVMADALKIQRAVTVAEVIAVPPNTGADMHDYLMRAGGAMAVDKAGYRFLVDALRPDCEIHQSMRVHGLHDVLGAAEAEEIMQRLPAEARSTAPKPLQQMAEAVPRVAPELPSYVEMDHNNLVFELQAEDVRQASNRWAASKLRAGAQPWYPPPSTALQAANAAMRGKPAPPPVPAAVMAGMTGVMMKAAPAPVKASVLRVDAPVFRPTPPPPRQASVGISEKPAAAAAGGEPSPPLPPHGLVQPLADPAGASPSVQEAELSQDEDQEEILWFGEEEKPAVADSQETDLDSMLAGSPSLDDENSQSGGQATSRPAFAQLPSVASWLQLRRCPLLKSHRSSSTDESTPVEERQPSARWLPSVGSWLQMAAMITSRR
eukprot:TRINITY_DN2607_c0_g1_i5.p1 TRINITY_DN2607_c0_g1~~TRINITY_DN2607_c0_g1_i5.p1  ORF type:complete len:1090 (-),score=273.69 TRINITY_DN2607_c0_g1_i5:644-3913(-)